MALPLPDLDDRRWDDLVEEGRSLIPFYAPEWTDHNAHDPGITLLELFAWLAEMDLFELNQISDRQRRKLLALAGVMSKPASPAHALLRLEPAGAAPVSIEAGLEFSGLDPFGAEVRFRALHGLDALPGSIAALQTANGDAARNLTGPWKRGEALRPFGDNPARGSTVMIGIAPVAPWSAGSVISLGFVLDGVDRGDDVHHGVRLAWEVRTASGSWIACDARDETRSLSRSGRVEITVPISPSATVAGAVAWPLIWFRARVARGRHDAALVLRSIAFNAVSIEQSVPNVIWLRIKESATVPATPAPIGSLIDPDFDLDRSGAITRFAFTSPAPDRPPDRRSVRCRSW